MEYRSREDSVAACLVWIAECRATRAPVKRFGRSLRMRVDATAADDATMADPARFLGATRGWKVTDAEWVDKFHALIAAARAHHEAGPRAWRDLHTTAADTALRLSEVTADEATTTFASWADHGGLYLFDPQTGLWHADVDGARDWVVAHMAEHHPEVADGTIVARDVRLPILIHSTWIGPPAPDPVSQDGTTQVDGQPIRKDVTGVAALARRVAADPNFDATVVFHCLADHEAAFGQALAGTGVHVRSLESQLPSNGRYHDVVLTRPNLADLDLTVDYILRESVSRDIEAPSRRDRVNVKNLWSLYCLYTFGGYHLDSGCLPTGDTLPAWPTPDRYGFVGLEQPAARAIAPLRRVSVTCTNAGWDQALLLLGTTSPVLQHLFPGPKAPRNPLLAVHRERTSGMPGGKMDVWLLRSPRRHSQALRALTSYVQAWFLVRAMRPGLSREMFEAASREIILMAARTAITPTDPNAFWGAGDDLVLPHRIELRPGTTNTVVPSLGIRKVGYRSHETTNNG